VVVVGGSGVLSLFRVVVYIFLTIFFMVGASKLKHFGLDL
jgi:hypothetical protein